MKYWGIDIGKDITACVARDETGAVVQTESVRDLRSVCNLIQEDDRVAVEWTGGRGRMLLEMLWERGVRQTYIYKGWLKADRLHLGYQRKGDVPDASTIAYALYATFTPGVPFREGALTEYAQMRNIYALRLEASRIDSLTRLKVQLQNLSHSLKASKAEAKMDAVIDVLEKEITASYALFRRACLHCQPVVEVLKVLREIFNGSDRAIYMLAVQIAPLERFRTADALKRYCGLLQQFPESGGRATSRAKWRLTMGVLSSLPCRYRLWQVGGSCRDGTPPLPQHGRGGTGGEGLLVHRDFGGGDEGLLQAVNVGDGKRDDIFAGLAVAGGYHLTNRILLNAVAGIKVP